MKYAKLSGADGKNCDRTVPLMGENLPCHRLFLSKLHQQF